MGNCGASGEAGDERTAEHVLAGMDIHQVGSVRHEWKRQPSEADGVGTPRRAVDVPCGALGHGHDLREGRPLTFELPHVASQQGHLGTLLREVPQDVQLRLLPSTQGRRALGDGEDLPAHQRRRAGVGRARRSGVHAYEGAHTPHRRR